MTELGKITRTMCLATDEDTLIDIEGKLLQEVTVVLQTCKETYPTWTINDLKRKTENLS